MEQLDRRRFLSRVWLWTTGLVASAGAWTTWDVLRPSSSASAGPVRTIAPADVPSTGVLEVSEINGYFTQGETEPIALWWRCPHLGCKVPWCESSGQFECPCHGSVFNRVGEYRRGPAPRGMDRFATTVENGLIVVDTGSITNGEPPGDETIDEPPPGPECLGAEG